MEPHEEHGEERAGKTRGPRGQPKGSITTDPDEVDRIVRTAYGKIYEGNTKEPDKLKKEYFQNYKKYIFTTPEAQAEPLHGKRPPKSNGGHKRNGCWARSIDSSRPKTFVAKSVSSNGENAARN